MSILKNIYLKKSTETYYLKYVFNRSINDRKLRLKETKIKPYANYF